MSLGETVCRRSVLLLRLFAGRAAPRCAWVLGRGAALLLPLVRLTGAAAPSDLAQMLATTSHQILSLNVIFVMLRRATGPPAT